MSLSHGDGAGDPARLAPGLALRSGTRLAADGAGSIVGYGAFAGLTQKASMTVETWQAIATSASAVAALCSAAAAWASRSVAQATAARTDEVQRSTAARELRTSVEILCNETQRAIALCEQVRIHSVSYAAMIGAAGGSDEHAVNDDLARETAALQEILGNAKAMRERIGSLAGGNQPDIVDALARVDANLQRVRVSAGDRQPALYRLMELIVKEVDRQRPSR